MQKPIHVSLVAVPSASIATLHGLYDVLNSFTLLGIYDDALPSVAPFRVEIVGAQKGPVTLSSGLTTETHQSAATSALPDIIIVPSMVVGPGGWEKGRFPELVEWITAAHAQGASLCSACSGVFLLAETGLFDGRAATLHWGYKSQFERLYPEVALEPEQALVVSGQRGELVSSGAAMSWHDLVLYLIAHHVSRTAAQAMAKFFALQWHSDGLGPYMSFEGKKDHGDAAVLAAQGWLTTHYAVADPVSEVLGRSGLAERTFLRRFQNATGLTPLGYVQQLRIEDAKRRLERTTESIETIGWHVGYEEPAFFRRLFKRVTGVTPGRYRQKFQIPSAARGVSVRG